MAGRSNSVRAAGLVGAAGLAMSVLTAAAHAQDSVPTIPGGNDALSAYVGTSQRVRYVVDGAAVQTSWGNTVLVAPVLKASREDDPMFAAFRTLILGSGAVSAAHVQGVSFASRNYSVWTTPGQGVHPAANSAAGTVARTGFDVQLAVGASEFGVSRSSVIGALIGLDLNEPGRVYVERVMALVSRSSDAAADTATLSLGAVDAAGYVAVRADSFNTNPATATRVLGDNILRVNCPARGGAANTLAAFGGANFVADPGSTVYIVSNEATPTNTPTLAPVAASAPAAVAFDLASRLRMGTTLANLDSTTGHLSTGIAAHRGNPTFSPLATLPGGSGSIGAVASLARVSAPAAKTNTINVFDLSANVLAGNPPVVDSATRRSYSIPSPVSVPGYTTNSASAAVNKQYLSQTAFRGGNGQVGLGSGAGDSRVMAMGVSDPAAGDAVVVVTVTGETPVWTVAAHPGQEVLDGPNGTAVGELTDPVDLSAPGVDLLGNVYFVASWQPSGPVSAARGLFKAVNLAGGYQLELLLSTGQQVAGPNSGRMYTIADLALRDGDSIASGAFHAQQLIQQQLPGMTTSDPASISAAGGLSVHAVLDYDNAGQSELYDAVLLVLPGEDGTPPCAADFDNNGTVQVPDIFAFLTAWFAGDPSAFEFGGTPGVPAIFAFLTAWFAGCP